VESKDWANLIVENGINSGGITGIKRSEVNQTKKLPHIEKVKLYLKKLNKRLEKN